MNEYDNKDFFDEYAKMPRSREGLTAAGEWHQLKGLFPKLSGKSVLDLGCGYGWHCKYSAVLGAKYVLGLDISEKMVERAKSINSDANITYRVCGIDSYDYPEKSWDIVISNLALHYIEELNTVFRNINRTLKDDGILLINIEHPVFTSGVGQDWQYNSDGTIKYWAIDNYFYSGLRETNFLGCKVKKYHHTLNQIVMGLIDNGFNIEVLEEAQPPEEMMSIDGMKDELRRPMMLLIRARVNRIKKLR